MPKVDDGAYNRQRIAGGHVGDLHSRRVGEGADGRARRLQRQRVFPALISEQLIRRIVKRFRGGLVFKAHSLLYHSTLGLRAMKKKKRSGCAGRWSCTSAPTAKGLLQLRKFRSPRMMGNTCPSVHRMWHQSESHETFDERCVDHCAEPRIEHHWRGCRWSCTSAPTARGFLPSTWWATKVSFPLNYGKYLANIAPHMAGAPFSAVEQCVAWRAVKARLWPWNSQG